MLNNELNGNYNYKKMVNHRPMYQSINGINVIWYDGHSTKPEWMITSSTTLDAGKFTSGFAQSNQDAQCPDFGNASTEYRKSKWSSNTRAVTCNGRT